MPIIPDGRIDFDWSHIDVTFYLNLFFFLGHFPKKGKKGKREEGKRVKGEEGKRGRG